ncbi:MAG: OB-fold nucleic acid binding domain-containing protein, partial [Pseudomonadota bacterium]|nr:OB-fold nucleic acid binding domain-containing protein [Pseudomonadota bacterium]
ARQQAGEFSDLFDFCHRIDLKKANKRTLEALIRAGAMDCLGEERASLMDQLPEAVQASEQARQNRESGTFDLFGDVTEVQRKPTTTRLLVWSDEVRLKGEKDTLGLYLTGHPIDVYQDELKRLIPHRLNAVSNTRRGSTTVFAGLIMDIKNFGNRILIVLDDGTARLEVSTGQEKFNRYKDLLQIEQIIVIEGEVYERDGAERPTARLHKAFGMNEIRSKRANCIVLTPPTEYLHANFAQQLQQLLQPFCQGDVRRIPIQIALEHQYAQVQLELGQAWQVRPEDDLLRVLREFFGKAAILVQYQLKARSTPAAIAS